MKKVSPKTALYRLEQLKKSQKDTVTLMGCKIPWNGLRANINLEFDNSISRDMSIGIIYLDGKGVAYSATKSLPLSHYNPLTIKVTYSNYSRKHLGITKEFEYYDVID